MAALSQRINNGFFTVLYIITMSLILLSTSHANTKAPDDILKAATTQMLESINTHRLEIKRSPKKLTSLVEQIILPHLDFITASKLVMGKYWRRAEKAQKIAFIRQFRTLLLRFYSSALAEYLSDKDKDLDLNLIEYFPLQLAAEEKSVTVRAELQPETGKKIPIYYRMHITSKGWKIFDVSVEGISMITTYKNNFATQLKTEGIDALIASLEEKNKEMLVNNNNATKKTVPQ